MRTLSEFSEQVQEDISLYLNLFPNRCSEDADERVKLIEDLNQIVLNRTEEFQSFCLTDESNYSNV